MIDLNRIHVVGLECAFGQAVALVLVAFWLGFELAQLREQAGVSPALHQQRLADCRAKAWIFAQEAAQALALQVFAAFA